MSRRSDTLNPLASHPVDTQFTQRLVESGKLLQSGQYSLLFRTRGQSISRYRSPVRGSFLTRQIIRLAIEHKAPLVLRYRRKSVDAMGKLEVKNYRVLPTELKFVRVRDGRKALGVYATKIGTGELRLFLIRDIILCRLLHDVPVKSARDRVLEG